MADAFSEKIAPPSKDKADGTLGGSDGSKGIQDVEAEQDVMKAGRDISVDVAVAKNGLKLQPQPTADPLDPLNWTSLRKHTILVIVMYL